MQSVQFGLRFKPAVAWLKQAGGILRLMIRLFAGLGSNGAMRFIGEVERGAACGCSCPECGSPLVAKQGNEKEWHFAHEGGQERPECEAGAINMLRRLAVEHLQGRDVLELPRYSELVKVRSSLRELSEDVGWGARLVGPVQWVEHPAKAEPVGRGPLDVGCELEIFVEIGDQLSRPSPPANDTKAGIVFWSPLPMVSDLRERTHAEQHIRNHGRFIWRHHPDSLGTVDVARSRLRVQAKQDDDHVEHIRQRQAEDAGRKWAIIAGRLQQQQIPAIEPLSIDDGQAIRAPDTPPTKPIEQAYDWAPQRKANTAFIFYRLHDDSAWVVYTLQDGSHAIAAWPSADDGWDEALPQSVGVPDEELGVYRARDLVSAMTFLAARAAVVRATSDPREFGEMNR